jgi:glycosyltransferase involved in cell wall biosynthesis
MVRNNPRISVVIPCYNTGASLSRCLEAVQNQSLARDGYDVIVVDNNSSDDTPSIARRYPGVELLTERKQGSYAARNLGIRSARGELLAFTDPDCVPSPDWLASIDSAHRSTGARVILGRRDYRTESEPLRFLAEFESEKAEYVGSKKRGDLYYGYTNNMAVHRSLFDELGLFPEVGRGGDTLFVQRVVQHLSVDVIRFDDSIRVTHLEVASLVSYYGKRFIRGRSNYRLPFISGYRPLRHAERVDVFNRLRKRKRLSPIASVYLFALLVVGAVFYGAGHAYAKLIDRGTEL